MPKNKSNKAKKRPKPFIIQDKYFLQAKKEWYRARSVYKLQEIQEKYKVLKEWDLILDIWAAPWSFLQYMSKILWEKSKIIWVDIEEIKNMSAWNIILIKEDIFNTEILSKKFLELWVSEFDTITSDIAPKTSWQKDVDQYRSVELNLAILEVSKLFLKKWWNLILKVFVGEDVNDLFFPLKKDFYKIKKIKPKACRDRSFEEYFVCLWKK